MIALENRLHTASELLTLATEELMRRAPDRPMMFRFADGTAGSVDSDRWRRETAGQTAMLTLCRMLDAGEIVPRGPFGTPTVIDIMPDTVQRSCALDRADAEKYLVTLGIAVEDAQQAEGQAPAEPTLNRAQTRLLEIVEMLERYAQATGQAFNRHAMPGPLGSDWQDEGSFHWLCGQIDPAFMRAATTFKKHRIGICAVQPWAPESDLYRRALAHIAPKTVPIDKAQKTARKAKNSR